MPLLTVDYNAVFLNEFSKGAGQNPWAAPATGCTTTTATIVCGVEVTTPVIKSGTNATFQKIAHVNGESYYFFTLTVTGGATRSTFCLPHSKINHLRLQWS